MGGAVLLPHSLFGLIFPSTGPYRLLGRARSWCQNGGLRESSCQWLFSGTSPSSVLVPTVSHSPPTSPGDPPRPAHKSSPGSYEVTVFALHSGIHEALCVPIELLLCARSRCTWDLVCALQVWSLCFPQSCGTPAIKPSCPSKGNALGSPPPDARSLVWGSLCTAQSSHYCGRTSVI